VGLLCPRGRKEHYFRKEIAEPRPAGGIAFGDSVLPHVLSGGASLRGAKKGG